MRAGPPMPSPGVVARRSNGVPLTTLATAAMLRCACESITLIRLRPMKTSRRFGAGPPCAQAKPRCATKPPAVAAARALTKSRRLRMFLLLRWFVVRGFVVRGWNYEPSNPEPPLMCGSRREREHHERLGISAAAVGTAARYIHRCSVRHRVETVAA